MGSAAVADASVAGCVVLATCNRFEVYLEAADGTDPGVAAKAAVQAVANMTGLSHATTTDVLRLLVGARPVAEHLFAVASGLDSMVVGEREVAGQVRRALEVARTDGTTSPMLERLFQSASRASRAVGAGTGLGSSGRSVAAVALDLAADALADGDDDPLVGARVLVIGTGAFARATVKVLRRRGAARIVVHSPSGRSVVPVDEPQLAVVPGDGLVDALAQADLVVGCSGVRGPVVGPEELHVARRSGRAGRSLVLVDLALRHDIDPAVADVPGVTLIDLVTVQERAGLGTPVIVAGQQIVAVHARRFADRIAELEVVPAVVALRSHVHALVDAEVARLPAASRAEVEPVARRIAAQMLHEASERARELARRGEGRAYRAAVELLVGADPSGEG